MARRLGPRLRGRRRRDENEGVRQNAFGEALAQRIVATHRRRRRVVVRRVAVRGDENRDHAPVMLRERFP